MGQKLQRAIDGAEVKALQEVLSYAYGVMLPIATLKDAKSKFRLVMQRQEQMKIKADREAAAIAADLVAEEKAKAVAATRAEMKAHKARVEQQKQQQQQQIQLQQHQPPPPRRSALPQVLELIAPPAAASSHRPSSPSLKVKPLAAAKASGPASQTSARPPQASHRSTMSNSSKGQTSHRARKSTGGLIIGSPASASMAAACGAPSAPPSEAVGAGVAAAASQAASVGSVGTIDLAKLLGVAEPPAELLHAGRKLSEGLSCVQEAFESSMSHLRQANAALEQQLAEERSKVERQAEEMAAMRVRLDELSGPLTLQKLRDALEKNHTRVCSTPDLRECMHGHAAGDVPNSHLAHPSPRHLFSQKSLLLQ